jgi:pimeloyl-ACP methyl ester carboxylesterase
MEHDTLELPDGRRIAYRLSPGRGPGVVFLGGFRSDMTGTKAQFLEAWARAQGRGFVRFDYTGHGASSGDFRSSGIGDWARDARDAILRLTQGPQVLVGSSMGGWIALLFARRAPARVAGLIGIAAAPDFTEDSMWAGFDARQRAELETKGEVRLPSEYDEEPYPITRHLIEDGRRNMVLREPLVLPFPVRLLHGTADLDVPVEVALRLMGHAEGPDVRLTLVKAADHRFSAPENLDLLARTLEEILQAVMTSTSLLSS